MVFEEAVRPGALCRTDFVYPCVGEKRVLTWYRLSAARYPEDVWS